MIQPMSLFVRVNSIGVLMTQTCQWILGVMMYSEILDFHQTVGVQ